MKKAILLGVFLLSGCNQLLEGDRRIITIRHECQPGELQIEVDTNIGKEQTEVKGGLP